MSEKLDKPSWIKTKPEELKKIIVELAKKNHTPSQIGIILRDKHSIPKSKLLGKKITEILNESNVTYKTNHDTIQKKISNLKSHIDKNKHDYSASRSLTKQLWAVYHFNKTQKN
jgi:ribosomal protein S15P/S13E